ncbi:MAG TPA: TfoX/Sxy family protein [Vicinamibacterales bacterium]|nr:TfoX/Sxy family protein [Vicinamibacterales bacterium]
MAVSASFLDFVLEQLSDVRDVWSKRMFGGVGLYRGDTFFGVIDNAAVFFKVDETSSARYRARKMPPFAPIPGKPPMRTYYQVPAGILEDAAALAEWAREAIAVGERAAAQPRNARAMKKRTKTSRVATSAPRTRPRKPRRE